MALRLLAMLPSFVLKPRFSEANSIRYFNPALTLKNLLPFFRKLCLSPHIPPARGALRIVTGVGSGCGGRAVVARRAAEARTAKACGPDLPTLGSSFAVSRCRPYRTDTLRSARRRWLKSPVHRGERADRPLTPIAQGRPECFGGPVVTNACAFYPRTRGYGCAKHPAFPAPFLISEGRALQDSGRSCRGNAQSHPLRCRAPA